MNIASKTTPGPILPCHATLPFIIDDVRTTVTVVYYYYYQSIHHYSNNKSICEKGRQAGSCRLQRANEQAPSDDDHPIINNIYHMHAVALVV